MVCLRSFVLDSYAPGTTHTFEGLTWTVWPRERDPGAPPRVIVFHWTDGVRSVLVRVHETRLDSPELGAYLAAMKRKHFP